MPEHLNQLFMMDKVQLERNRYHLLMHLIKSNRQGKAWEFFNQLRSNMLARTHHYAKILPLCDDVRYTMHLINEIRNNTHIVGDINVNCYRALVNQLLFECYNYDEIIKIVKDQQEIDKQYRRSGFDPKRFDKQLSKNLKYLTHPFDFREDSLHKSKTLAGKEILELEFMKL